MSLSTAYVTTVKGSIVDDAVWTDLTNNESNLVALAEGKAASVEISFAAYLVIAGTTDGNGEYVRSCSLRCSALHKPAGAVSVTNLSAFQDGAVSAAAEVQVGDTIVVIAGEIAVTTNLRVRVQTLSDGFKIQAMMATIAVGSAAVTVRAEVRVVTS